MRVEINGRQQYFDVEGLDLVVGDQELVERPTLIVLHGAPGISDHTTFKPAFSTLTDVAQVVYIDMAGAGRSDDPVDGVFSLEAWADDVVEFCSVLGIERPVVLGNSAGGMVAAVYGIRHPNHPSKLILSSTQAKLNGQRCADVFERLGGAEARDVAAQALIHDGSMRSMATYGEVCLPLYNPTKQPGEAFGTSIYRHTCAKAFHAMGGVWHTMDHLEQLDQITCPTLVLAGVEDPVTPIADSEDIVEHLTACDVQFERFDNAGHSVWNDDPERAFDVIRTFIRT